MAKSYTFTDLDAPANVNASASSGGDLDASTTYYYRVVAVFTSNAIWYSENGRSLASTEVSATTTASDKTIDLSWDAVTGAGGYRIWRTTSSGEYGTVLSDTTQTNSFSDSGSTTARYYTKFWDKPHGKVEIAGGTEEDPITIEDLYAEDQANGWGVITQPVDDVYEINTYLHIEDYFEITNATIFQNYSWYAVNSSVVTFGELTDANTTRNGITLITRRADSRNPRSDFGTLNAYNSKLFNDYDYWDGYGDSDSPEYYSSRYQSLPINVGGTIQDCLIEGYRNFTPKGTTNVKNVVFSRGSESIWNANTSGTIDDLKVVDCSIACQQSTDEVMDMKNLGVVNCNRDVVMFVSTTGYMKLTNSEIDEDKIQWYWIQSGYDPYIDEWFTFDLTVQDTSGTAINGATVTMVDKDGSSVFSVSTDANGEITQQTIKYKRHTFDGTYDVKEWTYDTVHTTYSPHTVTISKAGYQTKIIKYTMDRKREEIETLEKVKDFNYSRKAKILTQ